eukprot:TRINITY_DN18256_c0_g1_i1.p1 TRINITY_DN18256_c0_g1~~TRINITY_DN18256_c0_g1_i1.p1  ORF type:complete len:241 (-),score=17.03 TRINITY_DN18256_c0_g1_i1:40-762(-)
MVLASTCSARSMARSGGYGKSPSMIADIAHGRVKYWEADRVTRQSAASSPTAAIRPRTNPPPIDGSSSPRPPKRPVSASFMGDRAYAGVRSGSRQGGKRVYTDGTTSPEHLLTAPRSTLGPRDEVAVRDRLLRDVVSWSPRGDAAGYATSGFVRVLREEARDTAPVILSPAVTPRLYRQKLCELPKRVSRSSPHLVDQVCEGAAGLRSERLGDIRTGSIACLSSPRTRVYTIQNENLQWN